MIHLEIVTPGRIVFTGEVKSFTAPGIEGMFQILRSHAPFISTIIPGSVKFTSQGDETRNFVTSGGTVEVHNNHITMLAESIIPVEDIDIAQAEKEKTEAERVLESKEPGLDKDAAKHMLLTAKAKIKAVSA
ncbi:MAG TPA: ATP synthase F1 subunit epsilon [Ignavibacteria bacterium]|nr:ATP synthase F1 subunit epsilon [Ignavibacteria bacterium]HMR00045.1 ATP synthase F1 subunit epsilon [Ignavibacteria bacterium]